MLKNLILINLPSNHKFETPLEDDCFVMKTCQRTLVLSYENDPPCHNNLNSLTKLHGDMAYSYLLEIICGLKSKLIGENEIVGQFKTSYKEYIKTSFDSRLLQILEKLFKDAKDIRSKYLIGLSQKTYASIARRNIVSRYKAKHVLILGSGQLAEDLINQFKKKISVSICARNTERVNTLAQDHDLNIIPWEEKDKIKDFPFIVNTIGVSQTIFQDDFFQSRIESFNNHLFIDLGSPSIVNTNYDFASGFMSLEDIFKEGAIREEKKRKQVQEAKMALNDIVQKRSVLFQERLRALPIDETTKLTYV